MLSLFEERVSLVMVFSNLSLGITVHTAPSVLLSTELSSFEMQSHTPSLFSLFGLGATLTLKLLVTMPTGRLALFPMLREGLYWTT